MPSLTPLSYSQLLEACWFLLSTAKHWGQPVPLQRILKKRPSGQMVPIFPDQGQLATSSKAPGWLSQIVTESKLALPATRQANESERWGDEVRKKAFYSKPPDQNDSRVVSQNNCLVKAWLPGSFMDQRWEGGRWGSKVKLFNTCKSPLEWGKPSGRGMC